MTEADEKRLTEIEALEMVTTPGPWRCNGLRIHSARGLIAVCPRPQDGGTFDCSVNVAFFMAAKVDIPWLIAQLRAAWAQLDAVRAEERERCAKAVCQRCHNGEQHSFWSCEARLIRWEDPL